MPERMREFDWDSIRAQQDELFEWLRQLGFAQHDRLRTHQANLRRMLDGEYERDVTAAQGNEVLWSIGESLEFVEACRHIKARSPGGFERVLKSALDGPVDPTKETEANNRGRNTMFELVMGAHMLAAGFEVEFRENPDVYANSDGLSVLIECKRPLSDSALPKNMYSAAKQLGKLQRVPPDLTVIAISGTRIFNGKTLQGVESFGSLDLMYEDHHRRLHSLIDGLDCAIHQIKRHRVSALLVHSAFPARVLDQARQFTFQERMMLASVSTTAAEGRLTRSAFEKVTSFY
jgi:hypothetical protein